MARGEFPDMLKVCKEKGICASENVLEIEGAGDEGSDGKLTRLRSSGLSTTKEISEDVVAKSSGSEGASEFMPS